MMRPIDFIENPHSDLINIEDLESVASLVACVFAYQHEHKPEPPNSDASPLLWAEFFLTRDIHDNLYGSCAEKDRFEYFVQRPEYAELVRRLNESNGVVLLVGQAGAGKTTLLRKFERDVSCNQASTQSEFDLPSYFFRYDFMKASNILHKASELSLDSVDSSLIILRKELCSSVISDLKENIPSLHRDFQCWLIENAKCGEVLRRRLLKLPEQQLPAVVDSVLNGEDADAIDELMQLLEHAEINDLLDFLGIHRRLVLGFDNVDRWPLRFQQLILQLAIDLGAKTRIAVSIRASNIERIVADGKGGNTTRDVILSPFSQEEFAANVFVTRAMALDRLRSSEVGLDGVVNDYLKKPTLKHLPEARIRQYLRDRLTASQRALEQMMVNVALAAQKRLKDFREGKDRLLDSEENQLYQETLRFLQQMNLGLFSALIREIVDTFKKTLIDEQVYHYSNNSMRHALFFYSQWFKTLIVADDPGFWYPRFFRSVERDRIEVNKRLATNYVYKRMLVSDTKGKVPHSLALLCLFEKSEIGVVGFVARVLEAIRDCASDARNDYWESQPVQLSEIEVHLIDKFGFKREEKMIMRDLLYSSIEKLQRMESHGHLGLLWCPDVHEGDILPSNDLTPSNSFILTPAGHYVIDVLSVKREFVYWSYMNATDVEFLLPQVPTTGSRTNKISYLSSCSEDYRIRATHYAVMRPLRKLFLDELADLRRRNGLIEEFLVNHLYLRILDSLSSNLADSDKFKEETELKELKSGYHALRDELQECKAHFLLNAKSRSA